MSDLSHPSELGIAYGRGGTSDRACANGCEIVTAEQAAADPDLSENPLLPDGYCQGCHDYPEG